MPYCIKQRKRASGSWRLADTTNDTAIRLKNQHTGKELEYRVISNNKFGDGSSSNTVMAI